MRSRKSAVLAGVIGLATAFAAPLWAQEKLTVHQRMARIREQWIAAGKPPSGAAALDSPEFGTVAMSAIEVQAYEFQPGYSTDPIYDDGNGYRYFAAVPANPYLAAPVQVPTGAVIDFLKFSGCQTTGGNFVLGLWDGHIAGEGITPVGSLITPDGVGCFNASAEVNYTYDQSAHHPLYLVLYSANNAGDGANRFNLAQIYYHRIVSPAPETPSFADVPVDHQFYQFIEALKASGITGGCGTSNYCPDNPVTRGQMATFLAKALGLHWPN